MNRNVLTGLNLSNNDVNLRRNEKNGRLNHSF